MSPVKIVTAEVMRALDRRAMDTGGIPGVVLMENAGRAVFTHIASRYQPIATRSFAVFCGTGNNGGDGFVIARYLKLAGATVCVKLVGDQERIVGDARVHYNLMRNMGIEPQNELPRDAICVDALLGTGAQGAPRDEFAEVIRWINSNEQPIISVDLPSGIIADTGEAPGESVHADLTVTFAFPKLGHMLYPGAEHTGELALDDIGFDWETLSPETPFRWFRLEDARVLLTRRDRSGHKGTYGHLLVVGGSRGMSGAPTMTAKAALRSGVGLLTVATTEGAQPIIASKIDEAMTVALPEQDGALFGDSFAPLVEYAVRCDAICIGPGLTQQQSAALFALRAVNEFTKPMVLDADGLNALARFPEALNGRKAPLVLTPHPAECARLLDCSTEEVLADRISAVRQTALRYRCVALLKGAHTLICDGRVESEARITVCTTGNPGMATGGSGDALTGITGAFLAQGIDAYEATCLAVFIHGLAGDIAAQITGETAMAAGDIIGALPQAIRQLGESL